MNNNDAEEPKSLGILSPEADSLLADSVAEFDAKQLQLSQGWRFNQHIQSNYNVEDSSLTLQFADGAILICEGQLIGTFCVSDRTFEWAWNNPRFPRQIVRDSFKVKKTGLKEGVSYLTKGMIPIPDEVFLSYLCAIAVKITNADGMFRGSGDDVHTLIAVRNLKWADTPRESPGAR